MTYLSPANIPLGNPPPVEHTMHEKASVSSSSATTNRGGTTRILMLFVITIFLLTTLVSSAHAAPVDLGTVKPFVVLGGATVTNTGPSVLNGDLGVSPGTALVGFGLPAVVNGATHDNDGVASQAQLDLTTAYDVAAGQSVLPANDLTGSDLGNRTLQAGTYKYTSSAQLTGALTLDAAGDPAAQFVFQIASSLTTASASSVVLLNGASPCNVYWQIGSSATLGSTTHFQGNLMALTSVSLNDGVTVLGRMLARNGQVSLINDVLTIPNCTAGTGGTGGGGGTGTGGGGTTGGGTTGGGTTGGGTTSDTAKPVVHLSKTVNDKYVHVGQRLTYTLWVRNVSKVNAKGVVVCDRIPAKMQFVRADHASSFTNGKICFALGTVRAHHSETVRLILMVDRNIAPGVITNTATETAANTTTVVRAKVPVRVMTPPHTHHPPSEVSG